MVAESWLNDRTDNATRGSVFAVYTTIMFAGEASGQLLLNAADPARLRLFVIASIIVSAALVPILLSAAPQPEFEQPERLSLRQLVRISPLGVTATLGAGMVIGALSGMGAVYAKTIALPLAWVSFFMAAWTLGGALLQWPVGRASDLVGRRVFMALTAFAAAAVCLLALTLGDHTRLRLIGSMALLGGLLLPLYELAVAQTHDRLRPQQRVAASSGLMLAYGAGSILGPIGASLAMKADRARRVLPLPRGGRGRGRRLRDVARHRREGPDPRWRLGPSRDRAGSGRGGARHRRLVSALANSQKRPPSLSSTAK